VNVIESASDVERRKDDPRELERRSRAARGVYRDAEVYETEIRRIFLRPGCMSATRARYRSGATISCSRCGRIGDHVRNAEGGINALLNVCRHRGSRSATTGRPQGATGCPYHGWQYGLDGGLRAAGNMPEGFDRSRLGLRRLHTRGSWGSSS
jgi:Rieske 2Fe-2S family protein